MEIVLPEVTLISDSQIVLGWANGSYRFKQENKLDKYKELRELVMLLNVKTKWCKGHSGNVWNERCDKLANLARKGVMSTEGIDKHTVISDTRIGTKRNAVVCLWFNGQLKVIDLEEGVVENYNREAHGKRGSMIEIREEKSR